MAVRALQHESIDLEKAMQEATRLDMLGLVPMWWAKPSSWSRPC